MQVTNKQFYHCSICGRTSTLAAKIAECEKSHVRIDEAGPIKASYAKTRGKYPHILEVPMQDGRIAVYEFSLTRAGKEDPDGIAGQ